MTQEESLKKLLEGDAPSNKLVFLYNWLEDINWHPEARILSELIEDGVYDELDTPFMGGKVSAFSHIFGWGLNTKEWNYTSGVNFVLELLETVDLKHMGVRVAR